MVQMVYKGQAREYFDLGVFEAVEIVRVPMRAGWMVTFTGRKGEAFTLSTVRGELREFATLDAAVSTVEAVGFRVACIRLLA